MDDFPQKFSRLCDDARAAAGNFHTWWALASTSDPRHLRTMAHNGPYIDFFNTAKAGFLSLTFVSLAKVYGRDCRVFGMEALREHLSVEWFRDAEAAVAALIEPRRDVVRRVLGIRNKLIAHNQAELTPDEVTAEYGVSPDELSDLIAATRDALRFVAATLGMEPGIPEPGRFEQASMAVLEALQRERATSAIVRALEGDDLPEC